jgi:cell wall-associated NlpC family hydrolase
MAAKTTAERFVHHADPDRVEVWSSAGEWLATFTTPAYTVTLKGPRRRFTEATAGASVSHSIWVRTLPAPFSGEVDTDWLAAALEANANRVPDVLALAMQYIKGAPPVEEAGRQIAGDAGYGPLEDGERQEGADFNDYLGMPWTYPDGELDPPETRQWRCLDCSGFVRMVWGFRHHLRNGSYLDTVPLSLHPGADHGAIPRRAFQIYAAAPGAIVIPNEERQVAEFGRLAVGDLVFFDADAGDGTQLDHVGMYLGPDAARQYRFLSSRKQINGPTLGDYKGRSVLDGTGLYAKAFRAARRL